MRTAFKRAVSRAAGHPTEDAASASPAPAATVALYRADPPKAKSGVRRLGRVFARIVLTLLAVLVGAGGGAFLWFDRSVAALQARSPALLRAAKQLSIPAPGRPAIALLLGIDTRAGGETGSENTDTMMLVRADPATQTISLLSFPRDLNVPIYCSGTVVAQDRINSAYAHCGPKGVLETVRRLSGLSINYLITVDFHGFKRIVDRMGGIWIDVDRSYYNKNVGTAATDYSNIDLQPGYQRLTGGQALAFVRYRHTDSDLYRLAREQEFVRAVKEQVAEHFDSFDLPSLVTAITSSVQVASKTPIGDSTVLGYALLGATLPAGHVIQTTIPSSELSSVNVGGADELATTPAAIQQAVGTFEHPKVIGAKVSLPTQKPFSNRPAARAVPAPAPAATTITVLNGNGVPGAATEAMSAIGDRGYHMLLPPHGALPDAPSMNYPKTTIYFDRSRTQAAAAAASLAKLIGPADVLALPANPQLRLLDPNAMVLVVLGHNYAGLRAPQGSAVRQTAASVRPALPPVLAAQVESAGSSTLSLLTPLAHSVTFKIEVPTVIGSGSQPDSYGGDQPVRIYPITNSNKAIRLVYDTGGNQYWGIEETDWPGAPVLADDNLQRIFKGRTYSLYYAAGHLHMVVLKANGATYWVVNTLLNALSNPTMIAIAEGLAPLGSQQANS